MIKTAKLPIIISDEDKIFIRDLQRQYSIVVRYAYNRYLDGLDQKEIRGLVKNLNNIEELNSWLIQCAILDAKAVFTRFNIEKEAGKTVIKRKQILFGGKGLLNRLHKSLISKQEFNDKRLRPLDIQGEQIHFGNRMFNLDIQDNNSLIFKVNRTHHIKINLPKLRTNWLNLLWKMEFLANEKQVTYSVKLTSEFIYISFDTKENFDIVHKENRCLGIDMNPNFIGVSVLEFNKDSSFKILETKMFDIQELTKRSGKANSDSKSKYLHNKLQFETIEITKSILNIAKSWNVKFIYLEDLHFKDNADHGTGFNRLTKNKWLKGLFQEQLKKRMDLFGFKTFSVNPAYTSIIGNLQYNFPDPINASIEIARRGQEVIIIKNKKFYPDLWIKDIIKEQWKQTQLCSPKSWKEIFVWLKNSKLKYRVSLDSCQRPFKVLSLNSLKSKTYTYTSLDNDYCLNILEKIAIFD